MSHPCGLVTAPAIRTLAVARFAPVPTAIAFSLCVASALFLGKNLSFYILCIVFTYCPSFAGLNTSSGSVLVVVTADDDCSDDEAAVVVMALMACGS